MSYATEQGVLNAQWNAAQEVSIAAGEQARPFVLMRPKLYLDGNQWCALYGDNIQDGVAGFGDTPALAAQDFDKEWHTRTLGANAPSAWEYHLRGAEEES